MNFENGDLYHIYNQGNNKIPIFYSRENYIFFLKKIKLHLLPHADIIAWCLMPNHFHLMLYVHTLELIIKKKIIESTNSNFGIIREVVDNTSPKTNKLAKIRYPHTINCKFRDY